VIRYWIFGPNFSRQSRPGRDKNVTGLTYYSISNSQHRMLNVEGVFRFSKGRLGDVGTYVALEGTFLPNQFRISNIQLRMAKWFLAHSA
jgi:hypothetical protein